MNPDTIGAITMAALALILLTWGLWRDWCDGVTLAPE